MSNLPVKKLWGYIRKDNMKSVLEDEKFTTLHEKYGQQIAVKAAVWDSGNISVQVYDKDKKESIDVLVLRPETNGTYTVQNVAETPADEADFPF